MSKTYNSDSASLLKCVGASALYDQKGKWEQRATDATMDVELMSEGEVNEDE